MNQTKPYVVCAAIRDPETKQIVLGARHYDKLMLYTLMSLGVKGTGWEQGFIDQFDNFLTRSEAWRVADANGQIRRQTGWESVPNPRQANVGDEDELFSENLY